MNTKDAKKKLQPKAPPPTPAAKDYLSTGSTLLNLAMTGKPQCGFLKGNYYLLVGDSQSGKTWLSLSCLAEASINSAFDRYRFIYDNGENGALMDVRRFFGRRMADRLEPPGRDTDGHPIYSRYVEQLYYHIKDALEFDKPFIYIVDSIDALSSDAEGNKFEEQRKAFAEGKETPGSYGDGKARIHSQSLRQLLGPLQDSGSILIFINQTRDKIGDPFSRDRKTHSGGRAITFYACQELWSSVIGKLHKTVKGKPRQIGTTCQVRIKKNRVQGKDRVVEIPIYWSCGIDDVGACVDYLCEEKHWKKKDKGDIIIADGLGLEMNREKLIHHIEAEGMEKDLQEIVAEVWDGIEEACKVLRKNRYE